MKLRSSFKCFALAVAVAASLRAQIVTSWNVASGNWSTVTNWTPAAPANDGTGEIFFDTAGTTTSNVDTPWTIYGMIIESPQGPLTLTGSEISFPSSAIIVENGSPVTINNQLFSSGGEVEVNSTSTLTLSNSANSFGALYITAGTVIDGAANSFGGGPVEVGTAAVLDVNFNETIQGLSDLSGPGGSVVIANGASLAVGLSSGTFSGVISGAGGIEKLNPSTLILTGANTYTGPTVIDSGGTVQLGNGGTTGSLSSSTIVSGSGSLSFELSGTPPPVQEAITGAVGVVLQAGSGTVQLAGANTYSGATTINAGTLQAGSYSAFGGTTGNSVVTIASGATMDLNSYSNDIGALNGAGNVTLGSASLSFSNLSSVGVFSGTISGTGSLVMNGYVEDLIGTNTYSGGTTVNYGTLEIDNPSGNATGSGPITITSLGTLQIGNGGADTKGYIATTSITDNGNILFAKGSGYTFANNISGTGGVQQDGTGVTTLSGTNTYSGVTNVFQGTLQAGSTSAFGGASGKSQISLTNDGTLDLNGLNNTVGSISGTTTYGGITLGSGTLTTNDTSASTMFYETISGTGSVVFGNNETTLTGNNTYSGGTSIVYGTVLVANSSGSGLGTGPISISALGTLEIGASSTAGSVSPTAAITDNGTINFARSDVPTYANVISGTGNIAVNAGGIELTGANTYSGYSNFNSGNSILDNPTGSATGTSAVYVGTGATLTIGANDAYGSLNPGAIVNDAGTFIFNRSDNPTSDVILQGTGGLSMVGTGNVTLFQNNTYSGPTTIQNGQFSAGSATAFGNGASDLTITNNGRLNTTGFNLSFGSLTGDGSADIVTGGGGTLTLGSTNLATTFAGVISGGAGLSLTGSGSQALTGTNTYTGPTTIAAGSTLFIGYGGTTGSIANSSGVSGFGTLDLDRSDALFAFVTPITGSVSVIMDGGGTTALSGANTYSGQTTVNSGTLADTTANTLSPNSEIVLNPGTSLSVGSNETIADLAPGGSGSTVTIAGGALLTSLGLNHTTDFLGTITGSGGFEVLNGVQGLAGNSNYTGGTIISGTGELFIGTNNAIGTGTLTFTGSAPEMSPDAAVTLANTIVLNATMDNDDGPFDLTLLGQISGPGGITWCTPSALNLLGNNSFSGVVDMREGYLYLGTDTAAGTGSITMDSGTLISAYGSGVTRTIPNAINMTGSDFQIGNTDNNNITLSGAITSSGGENAITYVGGSAGTLKLTADNSGVTLDTGFVISSGTVIAANNNAFGTNEVNLTGSAGLNVQTGITIGNNLSLTGAANVLSGSGTIASAVTADSAVVISPSASPGNGPGTLTFSNGLTLASGGAIHFDIYDATGAAGTGYSLISATGGLNLTASTNTITFNIVSTDASGNAAQAINFNAGIPYSWTFASSSSLITGFSASDFNIVGSGFQNSIGAGVFSVSDTGNDLLLNFTPVPEPSTWCLIGTGALAIVPLAIRRRRAARA